MDQQTLTRPALGQVANLGDLYDARSDNFCGVSLLKKEIPSTAFRSIQNHSSDIRLIHSDTFANKFHNLDVNAELSVSVLAGLFSVSGSAKCLRDEKISCRAVKNSLLYNITTTEESLNINSDEFCGSLALNALQAGLGTHVVVGILWGANVLVSSEYKNNENRDITEVNGMLQAEFKKLSKFKIDIFGKADLKYKDGDLDNSTNFEIKIFGDILPQDEEVPTNFEEALELMKKLPRLIKSCNAGKGKPLKYTLVPINHILKSLNMSIKANTMLVSMGETATIRVVQLFDEILVAKQKIHDFCQSATSHFFCIKPTDLKEIEGIKKAFIVAEAGFRTKLAKALVSVRSGTQEMQDLENCIHEYCNGSSSPESAMLTLSTMKNISDKIAFADTLNKNKVIYVGQGKSLDSEMMTHHDAAQIVVLYFEQAEMTNTDKWNGNRHLFMQMLRKKDTSVFLAVDCDMNPDKRPKIGTSIAIFRNNKLICSDLFQEEKIKNSTCVARCHSGMKLGTQAPNQRVELYIICPGNECSNSEKRNWMCQKCETPIQYGFNNHIYCHCGEGKAEDYEFKCSDDAHGIAFEKFDPVHLKAVLTALRPFKEMNVLILGETGVGKSTWINAFLNFYTFETLAEAEIQNLCSLIPSQFTVCNENYEEIVVSTGSSANEVQAVGQSATQTTKVYTFDVSGTTIRLIDTPGVGDTRGIDQDQQNFKNILDTLSYLEELHGICIMLKPNNARLSVTFRFCVQELLTHLHKDACHNIVFCFTNSRGTFYKPGDTLPALRSLLLKNPDVKIPLGKDTIYCYDSEAFRFLAAAKNGVTFSDSERHNFAASWKASVTETQRMVKHISTLTPHKINSTISLNNARQLIVKLSKPLADVSRNIQTNIKLANDKVAEIQESKLEAEQLQNILFVPKVDLKSYPLQHPRTVCTNSKCTKAVTVDGNLLKFIYHQKCHDPCGLSGVTVDTIGHHELVNCTAMGGQQSCQICGHSYTEHMHVMYESQEIYVQVQDISVKSRLDANLSDAELKKAFLGKLKVETEEWEQEQRKLQMANAKFGCFLKNHAITPYNDAMIEYMDHLIREEKNKVAAGGNPELGERLKNTRDVYQKQFLLLEAEMQNSGAVTELTPDEVDGLVKDLCKLKHCGKSLHQALQAAQGAQANSAKYVEIPAPVTPQQSSRNTKWYRKFF